MAKILVVEDEPNITRLIIARLRLEFSKIQKELPEIVMASTATLAIKLINSLVPAVVILDIGLPDMSGKEVLTACADVIADHGTEIIIYSAKSMLEISQDPLLAGYIFIEKGDDPAPLITAIKNALTNFLQNQSASI